MVRHTAEDHARRITASSSGGQRFFKDRRFGRVFVGLIALQDAEKSHLAACRQRTGQMNISKPGT